VCPDLFKDGGSRLFGNSVPGDNKTTLKWFAKIKDLVARHNELAARKDSEHAFQVFPETPKSVRPFVDIVEEDRVEESPMSAPPGTSKPASPTLAAA
jgi:hypothetical protein